MRAAVSILFAPWWLYFILAAGIFYANEQVYEGNLKKQSDRRAALAQPLPDLVDLSAFDRTADIGLANEVHVSGWIATDHNYQLTKSKNGKVKDTRFMFVMFGKQDNTETRKVRAVILMTKDEKAYFTENLGDYTDLAASQYADQLYFKFNGYGTKTAYFDDMATDALAERGLSKAQNFIFLAPFWKGREAVLPYKKDPWETRLTGWKVAGAIALLGLIKLIWRFTRKHSQSGPAGSAPRSDRFTHSPIAPTRGDPVSRPEPAVAGLRVQDKGKMSNAPNRNALENWSSSQQPITQNGDSFLHRVRNLSQKSRLFVAGFAVLIGLLIFKPVLVGSLFPVVIVIGVWWVIARKIKLGVGGVLSELGIGSKKTTSPIKDDIYARLTENSKPPR